MKSSRTQKTFIVMKTDAYLHETVRTEMNSPNPAPVPSTSQAVQNEVEHLYHHEGNGREGHEI
jgi:hypothetical protein